MTYIGKSFSFHEHSTATYMFTDEHGSFPVQRENRLCVVLDELQRLVAATSNAAGIKDDKAKEHLTLLPALPVSHFLRSPLPREDDVAGAIYLILLAMSPGNSDGDERFNCLLAAAKKIPANLREAASVMMFGARKYNPDNWRQVRPSRRYADAALRHLIDEDDQPRQRGALDKETGLPHAAHALTCVLFLMEHQLSGADLVTHHAYGIPLKSDLHDGT